MFAYWSLVMSPINITEYIITKGRSGCVTNKDWSHCVFILQNKFENGNLYWFVEC